MKFLSFTIWPDLIIYDTFYILQNFVVMHSFLKNTIQCVATILERCRSVRCFTWAVVRGSVLSDGLEVGCSNVAGPGGCLDCTRLNRSSLSSGVPVGGTYRLTAVNIRPSRIDARRRNVVVAL